jgi:hypothetical protein
MDEYSIVSNTSPLHSPVIKEETTISPPLLNLDGIPPVREESNPPDKDEVKEERPSLTDVDSVDVSGEVLPNSVYLIWKDNNPSLFVYSEKEGQDFINNKVCQILARETLDPNYSVYVERYDDPFEVKVYRKNRFHIISYDSLIESYKMRMITRV